MNQTTAELHEIVDRYPVIGAVEMELGGFGCRIEFFNQAMPNPRDNVSGSPIRGRLFISHNGEMRRGGWWMDFPEKHWLRDGLTAKAYKALPVEIRAAMEVREQLTRWIPFEWRDAS